MIRNIQDLFCPLNATKQQQQNHSNIQNCDILLQIF
jgi:hypothetical protein